MNLSSLQPHPNSGLTSPDLAQKLRTGPIRSILDRMVRSAAEATGMPHMVLGLRHGGFGEFISTHGIPLSRYRDRVPAHLFPPKTFSREIEFSDLSKMTQFAFLSGVPGAHEWRYAGNVPVRLQAPLSDGGVLALTCVDKVAREEDGRILSVLRGYADTIGDLIWMNDQVEEAANTIDPVGIIRAVLLAGLSRLNIKVCVVDSAMTVLGYSKPFAECVRELGGGTVLIGHPLSGGWLVPAVEQAAKESMAGEMPRQWLPIPHPAGSRQLLDVFPITFGELGTFGVFALHEGDHAIAALGSSEPLFHVRDAADATAGYGNDGAGPLSRFLLDTLVRSQRLKRRRETSYIALRTWRTPIKDYQISALKALKDENPTGFVSAVADELAEAVKSVFGDLSKCVVVPVPCGSSGPDCLACRLATGLARRINVPMVRAFQQIETPIGNSHPRRNSRRGRMKLIETIEQPVILVDDVVTSGSHIDEAATILRETSPQVWSVVWIA